MTCIYSGQQSHQLFDEMILEPNLRKLIVSDYRNRKFYSIEGEVTEIEQISDRVCKDTANKIEPKAPVYKN